jgi:hypothetical protein
MHEPPRAATAAAAETVLATVKRFQLSQVLERAHTERITTRAYVTREVIA